MNCKPGDLAMIVDACLCAKMWRAPSVVTCVRLLDDEVWDVGLKAFGGIPVGIADKCLRPIRGDLTPEQMRQEEDKEKPLERVE